MSKTAILLNKVMSEIKYIFNIWISVFKLNKKNDFSYEKTSYNYHSYHIWQTSQTVIAGVYFLSFLLYFPGEDVCCIPLGGSFYQQSHSISFPDRA